MRNVGKSSNIKLDKATVVTLECKNNALTNSIKVGLAKPKMPIPISVRAK